MLRTTIFFSMTSVAELAPGLRKTGPLASFFVVVLALFAAGCGARDEPPVRFSGKTMGTSYHVAIVMPEQRPEGDLAADIQAALDDVDEKMSTYKPESELNRLNRHPLNQPFNVSPELMYVLELSMEIYRDTAGAFDPSVGPLVDLWGFGPDYGEESVPDQRDIAALVAREGFDSLLLSPSMLTAARETDIELDLSAVAKGYGADRVAELLGSKGITRYMVEVGGEVAVSGRNARGIPWQIAIERPVSGAREVQRVIPVSSGGMATSGDYRNYFERDGKRYSHTIDPRTGYPIDHSLASVTVVADSSARADALATAFMVMGTEAALNYAENKGIAILTLTKDREGFREDWSPAFSPYLEGEG